MTALFDFSVCERESFFSKSDITMIIFQKVTLHNTSNIQGSLYQHSLSDYLHKDTKRPVLSLFRGGNFPPSPVDLFLPNLI
jgi:hypothetical protein